MNTWLKKIPLRSDGRINDFRHQIAIANERYRDGNIEAGELVCRFDGILHMLDFIEQNHANFGNRKPNKNDSSFDRRESEDWTQYATYAEAIRMMREHPERFRHFDESELRLHDEQSVGNMIEFDTQGDYLDMGKVMNGEPESFGVMCGGRLENRFCSIVVNGNARCDVKKQAISRKASRILRLIDMLELNGVRCEVAVVFSTHQVHCEIVVKQYNDPLDINDIAVGLSPDFFRWAIFRLTEHSKLKSGGYGQPLHSSLADWRDDDADNTILVDGLTYDISTKDIDEQFDDLEEMIRRDEFASGRVYKVEM